MTEATHDNRVTIARHRLAMHYAQPYHRTAILSGQWDTGSLFRAALAEVDRVNGRGKWRFLVAINVARHSLRLRSAAAKKGIFQTVSFRAKTPRRGPFPTVHSRQLRGL